MIVVDASAIVDLLVERPVNAELYERLVDEDLHAPHLIDIEVLAALRRLERESTLSRDAAQTVATQHGELALQRYPHAPLVRRIWALRSAMSTYDAAYVALAEALAVPLVTSDARLGRSSAHHADIEAFSR